MATTDATVPDTELLDPIHAHLAERDLLPAEHLVDAGYVDAGILVTAASVHHVEVIGPVRVDTNWQARQGQGFAAECFVIDGEAKCVTCPQGKQSASWKERVDHLGHDVIDIADRAGPTASAGKSRSTCTQKKKGSRTMKLLPALAMPGAVRGPPTTTDAGMRGNSMPSELALKEHSRHLRAPL